MEKPEILKQIEKYTNFDVRKEANEWHLYESSQTDEDHWSFAFTKANRYKPRRFYCMEKPNKVLKENFDENRPQITLKDIDEHYPRMMKRVEDLTKHEVSDFVLDVLKKEKKDHFVEKFGVWRLALNKEHALIKDSFTYLGYLVKRGYSISPLGKSHKNHAVVIPKITTLFEFENIIKKNLPKEKEVQLKDKLTELFEQDFYHKKGGFYMSKEASKKVSNSYILIDTNLEDEFETVEFWQDGGQDLAEEFDVDDFDNEDECYEKIKKYYLETFKPSNFPNKKLDEKKALTAEEASAYAFELCKTKWPEINWTQTCKGSDYPTDVFSNSNGQSYLSFSDNGFSVWQNPGYLTTAYRILTKTFVEDLIEKYPINLESKNIDFKEKTKPTKEHTLENLKTFFEEEGWFTKTSADSVHVYKPEKVSTFKQYITFYRPTSRDHGEVGFWFFGGFKDAKKFYLKDFETPEEGVKKALEYYENEFKTPEMTWLKEKDFKTISDEKIDEVTINGEVYVKQSDLKNILDQVDKDRKALKKELDNLSLVLTNMKELEENLKLSSDKLYKATYKDSRS